MVEETIFRTMMQNSHKYTSLKLFCKAGFSVVFGSTGYRCSGSGRATFAPMARTLSARGTNS